MFRSIVVATGFLVLAWTGTLGSGEAVPDPSGAFAERLGRLETGDLDGRIRLARWGLEQGAIGEARGLLRECLEVAPDRDEPHPLLGRVRVRGAWLGPYAAWRRERPAGGSARWPRRPATIEAWGAGLRGSYGLDFETAEVGPFRVAVRVDDPARAARARGLIESFHAASSPFLFETTIENPVEVVLFRDRPEFVSSSRDVPPGAAGFYEWGRGRVLSFFGAGGEVLFHELAHALLDANLPARPPAWLNEGIAVFFEGCREEAGGLEFGYLTQRIVNARTRLRSDRLLALAEFVASDPLPVPDGWDQAGALSCYLYARGALRDAVGYWGMHRGTASGREVLEGVLAAPIGSIDVDFRRWLAGLKRDDLRIVPEGDEDPADMADALAACAALRLELATWCTGEGLHPQAAREARESLRYEGSEAAERIEVASRDRGWEEGAARSFAAYRRRTREVARACADRLAAAAGTFDVGEGDRDWSIAEALRADPDCAGARALRGEHRAGDLGWLAGEDPVRPDDRPDPPADWEAAWRIESEHYRIVSDMPHREALAMLARAERLHRRFDDLFRFDADLVGPEEPMEIHYHADRAAYDRHAREVHGMRPSGPPTGYFVPADGVAHFVEPDRNVVGGGAEILFHEGTHQLVKLRLSRPVAPYRGKPGFWAIEGIACYFEGYAGGGDFSEGPRGHWRLRAAGDLARRGRLPEVAAIAAWTDADISPARPEEAAARYAVGAALVHFFVHAEGGRWRGRFLAYLKEIEDGRGDDGSFERAFGRPPSAFDDLFRVYVPGISR